MDHAGGATTVRTGLPSLNLVSVVMVLLDTWLLSGPAIHRCGLPLDPPESDRQG